MTKYMLYPEVNNNDICEAVNCLEKPTREIKLKAGQRQIITLHLCLKCITKFDQKERMLEQVEEPLSNTNQSIQPLSVQGVASTK